MLMDMVDKVHFLDSEPDRATFDYTNRGKGLFAYLFRRFNTKLKTLVVGVQSGLEVFRRILRGYNLVTFRMEIQFALLLPTDGLQQVQQLGGHNQTDSFHRNGNQ